MNALPDAIAREVVIAAPLDRVYAAVAEPAQISQWFIQGVEGTHEPGERPVWDFGEPGKYRVYIVSADSPRYFALRWVDHSFLWKGFLGDPLAHPNTLVEFHFEPVSEGTRVRVVESGFREITPDIAEKQFKDNQNGWDIVTKRLKEFAEKG